MDDLDAENTIFRTMMDNYTIMLFGIKNAGPIYQCAIIDIFHDMMLDGLWIMLDMMLLPFPR